MSTWLPSHQDGSRQEAGVVGVCLWPEALTLQQPAVRRTVLGATGPRKRSASQGPDLGPRIQEVVEAEGMRRRC